MKIFFLSRESFAHTVDHNYVGVLKASVYFKTSVIPALTPGIVAETSSLKAWASFLQVQSNSSVVTLLTAFLTCRQTDHWEAALLSYMGNVEMWSPLDQSGSNG